jgi:putative membrane-bound dehydrogenase-like protein
MLAMYLWCAFACLVYSQGYAPDESSEKMRTAEGLTVEMVASEPLVRQPVAIDFDDRGRLWVIQYLQYPNPAELKRTKVDRFSRTQYDRVPEPPPHGPQGADRITILQDLDGDGRMDSSKDFISGLNLVSGLAFGHDGVFVLNVPYLLFYADRNRDDVPDGAPEVLLSGFGMEDAHSVANSLTWGPDGWLYGCQGSTVTANIRGIEFQQGVWRYHSVSRAFELFCEGGGNSWGLDFDRDGNLLYSTNYGGHVLLHGVQGGYFVKSFAKHGELHNPYAYGYFDHAPHERFSGGHVTVGGTIYQADALPAMFRNKYLAGDLLGHNVLWHEIKKFGSTVRTAHGGELLRSNDTWFAPTDLMVGPDGAVYISDWHDARTAHPDPDADWDRSNGRIYRISSKNKESSRLAAPVDFSIRSIDELLDLHRHRNQWMVRHARQELVRRHKNHTLLDYVRLIKTLREYVLQDEDEGMRLESLWTLYCLDGFDESFAMQTLDSHVPSVRSWTVRFLGDSKVVSSETAHRLDAFAEQEPDIDVRMQLACTARRLPADQAMPIINANINRDCDYDDPRIPLLWWWAVEKHSVAGRDEVVRRFVRPTLWQSRLGREKLMPRLVRRYAAENSNEGDESIVRLLKTVPSDSDADSLWTATLLGLQPLGSNPKRKADDNVLMKFAESAWKQHREDPTLLRVALILNVQDALTTTMNRAFGKQADLMLQSEAIGLLAGRTDPELLERALESWDDAVSDKEPLVKPLTRLLSHFDDPRVAAKFVNVLKSKTVASSQAAVLDAVVSRASFARVWLDAFATRELDSEAVSLDQVRRIALLGNAELDALVTKYWGRFEAASREEKLAEVRRLNNDLRAGTGNPDSGKMLFDKHCAACHTLYGNGRKVGPDLTSANRQDRDFLLVSLVDPNIAVRKEYLGVVLATIDGQVINGLITKNDEMEVVLTTTKGEALRISKTEIAEMRTSQVSIMPSDIYRSLSPQELRDLFAYLQRSQ